MGIKLITGPQEPLIPLEVCRQQCEVVPIDGDSDSESHPDDELILGMLDAAIEAAEDFTGLTLSQKTWEIALDAFPDAGIEIPKPPTVDILSVTYTTTDSDGELEDVTMSASAYSLDDYQMPNWLLPATGTSWPSTASVINAVKIRYTAGYGLDSDSLDLPKSIRAAVLLYMAHLYKNREESADKAMQSIPLGFEALLRPKRILLGMA